MEKFWKVAAIFLLAMIAIAVNCSVLNQVHAGSEDAFIGALAVVNFMAEAVGIYLLGCNILDDKDKE